jgi:hypothetical protein
MPRTTPATEFDIYTVKPFNPSAAVILQDGLLAGRKIEKVESSFNDPGEDYVKFMMDGKEICHIDGY